jgi:hypothetical protein
MKSNLISKSNIRKSIAVSEKVGCFLGVYVARSSFGLGDSAFPIWKSTHLAARQRAMYYHNTYSESQAFQSLNLVDISSQICACYGTSGFQGETMKKLMRKIMFNHVLQYGVKPMNYETILKKARCK